MFCIVLLLNNGFRSSESEKDFYISTNQFVVTYSFYKFQKNNFLDTGKCYNTSLMKTGFQYSQQTLTHNIRTSLSLSLNSLNEFSLPKL